MAAGSWFDSLNGQVRAWLLEQMQPQALLAGQKLFDAGDPSDCLYLVTRGALGAFAPQDERRLLGQVVAGETVGELGLITRRPRSATVRALRDSALMRLGPEGFDTLARAHPEAVLGLARLVLERAQRPIHQRLAAHPRTLALLPQTDGLDVLALAHALAAALRETPSRELQRILGRPPTEAAPRTVAVVRAADAPDADALERLEAGHSFVLYVADSDDAPWRQRCLRQADALLFVADVRERPARNSELEAGYTPALPRPEHLLLRHPGEVPPGSSTRWQALRPHAQLHHVRGHQDLPRVARLVEGRPIGLVLSGGGARGFAHLGVLRALEEARVPLDVVGGASIGAIIGAGYAAGWSLSEMTDVYRASFVAEDPLADWTLPFVSLVGGRAVSRLLKEAYGRLDVEDLVRPFFCLTTNLTRGVSVVHRTGPVWKWLRASAAIPGVLAPVLVQGQVHVDGGVMNNLPVDVMRDLFPGDIVAVDISADDAVRAPEGLDETELPGVWRVVWDWLVGLRRPSLPRLMLGSGLVNATAATLAARAASSLVLQPDVGDVDLLDWQAFDTAIERGYASASRQLAALQSPAE